MQYLLSDDRNIEFVVTEVGLYLFAKFMPALC